MAVNNTVFPVGTDGRPALSKEAEKKLELEKEVMTLFKSHNLTAGDALHVLDLCSSEIKREALNFVLR